MTTDCTTYFVLPHLAPHLQDFYFSIHVLFSFQGVKRWKTHDNLNVVMNELLIIESQNVRGWKRPLVII